MIKINGNEFPLTLGVKEAGYLKDGKIEILESKGIKSYIIK